MMRLDEGLPGLDSMGNSSGYTDNDPLRELGLYFAKLFSEEEMRAGLPPESLLRRRRPDKSKIKMKGAALKKSPSEGGILGAAPLPTKDKARKHRCPGGLLSLMMPSEFLPKEGSLIPQVRIPRNPSSFAVFAAIRATCLENQHRESALLQLQNASAWKEALAEDASENEGDSPSLTEKSLPKVVAMGISGVLELIKESQKESPRLCLQALSALLNILQGLEPEELSKEPSSIMELLFDTLMSLSTPLDEQESSQKISSLACACLLSFVVAYGDTGKILTATSCLLMSPMSIREMRLPVPSILVSLQKSIMSAMMGRTDHPDLMSSGLPKIALTDSFSISDPSQEEVPLVKCVASDGLYLYAFTDLGLYKIGSGYAGTIKGHVYKRKSVHVPTKNVRWMGFAEDALFIEVRGEKRLEILRINKESFALEKTFSHPNVLMENKQPYVLFCDGSSLGILTISLKDKFLLKFINPTDLSIINELPLKLAYKRVGVLGASFFEEGVTNHEIDFGSIEEDNLSVSTGKDFGLLLTSQGKVFYTGKSASLGFKSTCAPGEWLDLCVPKNPCIVEVAIGHDGQHACLLADDGTVYFTGTSRRGEDGEQTKARRQPKPVKPKKITRMEGHLVSQVSCNNGTSAFVTKEGKLFLFGKDSIHCDYSTGQVTDLKGCHIVQVAVGKAHIVALTKEGEVYTFGMNSKGQCGRDFTLIKEAPSLPPGGGGEAEKPADPAGAQFDVIEDTSDVDGEHEGFGICPAGKHNWKRDQCMVCTICLECTGYGPVCVSSARPDRNPGMQCGCGFGDSGCSECGCCRFCTGESGETSNDAEGGLVAAGAEAVNAENNEGSSDMLHRHLIRLDLIAAGQGGSGIAGQSGDYREKMIRRTFPKRHIVGGRNHRSRRYSNLSNNGSSGSDKSKRQNQVDVWKAFNSELNEAALSEKESDPVINSAVGASSSAASAKLTSIPPAMIILPDGIKVIKISSGHHHTIMLASNGDVYTFGNNFHGQLGVSDLLPRGSPTKVNIPSKATSVAAGSYHSLILTEEGEIYSFGMYQRGQLGREEPPSEDKSCETREELAAKHLWFAVPGLLPRVGPKHGRVATWIGASADQSFIKVDESLINAQSLAGSSVVSSRKHILLVPPPHHSTSSFTGLVINKTDGYCRSFDGPEQADLSSMKITIDPCYNVLWAFSKESVVHSYHPLSALSLVSNSSSPNILSPELALPSVNGCYISRNQVSLNMLSCLDTLTQYPTLAASSVADEDTIVKGNGSGGSGKAFSKEDYSVVNRFDSHGGGWGYSGHSIEAIRFMADTDILLGGFGLFGGRGEYVGKIRIFDIGFEGGDLEIDGEMLAESEEVTYECASRQKYPLLFEDPVNIMAGKWYVAWARVTGPSSDCGSSGQVQITTEEQIQFHFKSSKKSNNGTDVNAGQIPQLLYRVLVSESPSAGKRHSSGEAPEPVCVLSLKFSRSVTPTCFAALLSLLRWSWSTFKVEMNHLIDSDGKHILSELQRLIFICRATLRLIIIYTDVVYPVKVTNKTSYDPLNDTTKLAENVYEVRILLQQLLTDPSPVPQSIRDVKGPLLTNCEQMTEMILKDANRAYVACFHAFFPTGYLKWTSLCNLLTLMESTTSSSLRGSSSSSCNAKYDRLLTALLDALINPLIKLRNTFPITYSPDSDRCKNLSPTENLSLTTSMIQASDNSVQRFPVLTETMNYLSHGENLRYGSWSFREVLDRLLNIGSLSIKQNLQGEPQSYSPELVEKACKVISSVISELTNQSSSAEPDIHSIGGRILHVTPNRFTRTGSSKTWNTGNGSPDAICFSVDKPGIFIAGCCVYGGTGSYDYQLELLDDQSNSEQRAGNPVGSENGGSQRWNSLEVVSGSYSSDDCVNDIAELKFERAVPIRPHLKYALRLRNHGGRTSNGDGGMSSVRGPDGTNFSFNSCSLSFNGSNPTRGQLPQILYYSSPQESDVQSNTTRNLAEKYARRTALTMTSAIVKTVTSLLSSVRSDDLESFDVLNRAPLITTLMPHILASVSSLATMDPHSSVSILAFIQDMLPPVATLNNIASSLAGAGTCQSFNPHSSTATSSALPHYAYVESSHPYKASSVYHYRVHFPEGVRWLSVEFDSRCSTSQPEDYLQIFIRNPSCGKKGSSGNSPRSVITESQVGSFPEYQKYTPVLRSFHGPSENWPNHAIILPGNEVLFSLETASDYVKEEKNTNQFGFRCLVIGYEGETFSNDGLKNLEKELSYLGGVCVKSLMKRNLCLTQIEDMELVEESAGESYEMHYSLLSKGLALSHPPNINEALDGVIPYSNNTHERLFLKNFVNCVPNTAGGRLARWLQPESYVDVNQCRVLFTKEDMRCNWPNIITVITQDQYGDVVWAPAMKVEVRAVPIEYGLSGQKRLRRAVASEPDAMTFGGIPPPNLDTKYEITVKDKMFYHSITVQKCYDMYSFEELRFASPAIRRQSENMLVRPNNDGTYSANWTPGNVGWYQIHVSIDGAEIQEVYKVEVYDPPQGLLPPPVSSSPGGSNEAAMPNGSLTPSCSSMKAVSKCLGDSGKLCGRLRKFIDQSSAGLRIRIHPTLQSEQIGIVPVDGVVSVIEEIQNSDGRWVRLSPDSLFNYCKASHQSEGWCLQYNQHLRKILMMPVSEDATSPKGNSSPSLPLKPSRRKRSIWKSPGVYTVVKCGAACHNIRNSPSLSASLVGMLNQGDSLHVINVKDAGNEVWVQLDKSSMEKYCLINEGDAWSLALSASDVQHIEYVPDEEDDDDTTTELDPEEACKLEAKMNETRRKKKKQRSSSSSLDELKGGGVRKSGSTKNDKPKPPPRAGLNSPERRAPSPSNSKPSFFQKWFKGDQVSRRTASLSPPSTRKVTPSQQFVNKDIPPELQGVSVRDLVKVIGESRANGNGVTPPGTPNSQRKKVNNVSSGSSSRSVSPSLKSEVRALKPFEGNDELRPKKVLTPPPPPRSTSLDETKRSEAFKVPEGPIKEALSPSVAESIRTVFSAFVWHENIIHDTIAAASFLKFHPNLNKTEDIIKTGKISLDPSTSCSGRNFRKKWTENVKSHRHSMDVSSHHPVAHNNSNVAWNNANENNTTKRQEEENIKRGETQKSSGGVGGVTLCPPTLKLLAVLWEEIRSYCIHAILQQVIVSANPLHHTQFSSSRASGKSSSSLMEKRSKTKARLKSSLKSKEPSLEPGGGDKESPYGQLCEMCGQYFGYPVTYHMRLDHPGCGSHAGGKGYNSGGNYCKGWAGNCGDGGVGGSSWYLICGVCRDNYMKISSQPLPPPTAGDEQAPSPVPPVKPSKSLPPSSSISSSKPRIKRSKVINSSSSSSSSANALHTSGIHSHIIMKNNATFLLDLSSSSNNNESAKMLSSSSSAFLYSVSEFTNMDPNPFPMTPFQCFSSLCVKESVLRDMNDEFYLDREYLKKNNSSHSETHFGSSNNNNELQEGDSSSNGGGAGRSPPASIDEATVSPPEGFQSEEPGTAAAVSSLLRRRNTSHSDKDNRKRNSSCEEQIHNKKDDDFFLSHPSHDLQKLFSQSNGGYVVSDILQRPVMSFVLQWNDLDSLQLSMTNSIRKASCRSYAIQALNWLLRSVSQPDCLHDLLWFFVASLENSIVDVNNSNNDHYARKQRRQNQQKLLSKSHHLSQAALNENMGALANYFSPQLSGLNEHPSSDIVTGGEAIQPLPSTLYSLLQTISDLMLLLPLGSPLLQIAVTCWAIKFKPSDHQFLHQSHVFSSISKILSRSEEFDTNAIINNPLSVEKTVDTTSISEIKTSSRQSMISSLSDNSTETFWESGDEDRNKTKWISLSVGEDRGKRGHVCVHIDNCRDLVSKVSGITFKVGAREEDLSLIKQIDVENRFAGWISCYFDDNMCSSSKISLIKIEFKGPDSTLRIRQIKLLSVDTSGPLDDDKDVDLLIKQQNCESETLRVFRLMTAQVFGKLLRQDSSMDDSEEDLDLREHVVGILFNSKTRLSYLQKQVCSHIVTAIKKEASLLKEDWELSLCHHGETPSLSDTYCFEMLSLVLALSGSTVGKLYLSQQQGLIIDLLNLLHTGTARIQRQVILLIRRILPEIPPASFASFIGVKSLPPEDFSSLNSASNLASFDEPGLLDIFLSCIAKALTVQVKSKGGSHGKDFGGRNVSVVTLASSIHPKEPQNIGSRWWLRGSMAKRISEEIVLLLKDLMNGKIGSPEWMLMTKSAIAQNILNLTKLDRSNECLKLPIFWLGLASICVLNKDHVEGLSSGDSNSEACTNRPTCENHDDGETLAIIKCETCGNLCGDCDRFLHLHRRTKLHARSIFKEEEDAIKVDLHEGCGRMKLYWLMALADSTTLKAMVEFREAASRGGSSSLKNTFGGSTCRFCGVQSSSEVPVMDAVCTDPDCISYSANACVKTLSCGHFCGGILNEETCLPCLHGCSNVGHSLKQDADDMCMICFTEALSPIPSIMLLCGHVFHYHCCLAVLTKKWNGPRITFGFRNCPICKVQIQHPSLKKVLVPLQNLYEDVKRKSLMRLEYEGLNHCEAVSTKGGRYFNDPISYALDRYAYYVCFKCSKAYYGGEAQCDGALGDDKFNPEELVCGGCSDVSRAQMCLKHGMDYLEYKCRYCCSVAVFFCFGTTHFCNACHDDFQQLISVPQKDLPQCPVGPKALKLEGEECPLHVKHPPTGEEFALGCGICRNPHTF